MVKRRNQARDRPWWKLSSPKQWRTTNVRGSETRLMISIVVPVYNESESLPVLYREITSAAEAAALEYEICIVDDGSTDGTWQAITSLAKLDGRVRGLRFRRNFGKAAALSAGFRAAQGSIIITLD